jgi:hypothetical protein
MLIKFKTIPLDMTVKARNGQLSAFFLAGTLYQSHIDNGHSLMSHKFEEMNFQIHLKTDQSSCFRSFNINDKVDGRVLLEPRPAIRFLPARELIKPGVRTDWYPISELISMQDMFLFAKKLQTIGVVDTIFIDPSDDVELSAAVDPAESEDYEGLWGDDVEDEEDPIEPPEVTAAPESQPVPVAAEPVEIKEYVY